MKITKKTPLRQRGRSEEKRQSTKDAIREAYTSGPQREVQIMIRKMAEWGSDEKWNIPGAYFAEDNAIVYDIKAATLPAEKKSSRTARATEEVIEE